VDSQKGLVPFQREKWFDRLTARLSSTLRLRPEGSSPKSTPRKTVREPHRPEEDRGIEGPNLRREPCVNSCERVQRKSWHKRKHAVLRKN
jgi:hypothetical protein